MKWRYIYGAINIYILLVIRRLTKHKDQDFGRKNMLWFSTDSVIADVSHVITLTAFFYINRFDCLELILIIVMGMM